MVWIDGGKRMSKLIEEFKQSKGIFDINRKRCEDMRIETETKFATSIQGMVEKCSQEDLEEFLNSDDEKLDDQDKQLILLAYLAYCKLK